MVYIVFICNYYHVVETCSSMIIDENQLSSVPLFRKQLNSNALKKQPPPLFTTIHQNGYF